VISGRSSPYDRISDVRGARQVGHQIDKVFHGHAVNGGDYVAAYRYLLAVDLDLPVAALHACFLGRTELHHLYDQDSALVGPALYRLGQIKIQGTATDAQPGRNLMTQLTAHYGSHDQAFIRLKPQPVAPATA
jgi:hypothetical protein